MAIDASDRPNDSFGYSVYAVVAFAPPELADPIDMLRRTIATKRASIPAHVTVKGTFCGIDSLDVVCEQIGAVAQTTAPVQIDFADPRNPTSGESRAVLWAEMRLTSDLLALNDALEQAIGPLSTNAYSDEPYQPHLTFCQGCSSEQINHAMRLAAEIDFGTGFLATAIDLMGRIGPAYGGRWESAGRFPLIG